MKIRLWIIKICISSLWNSYYPVNMLKKGYDQSIDVIFREREDSKKEELKLEGSL